MAENQTRSGTKYSCCLVGTDLANKKAVNLKIRITIDNMLYHRAHGKAQSKTDDYYRYLALLCVGPSV